MRRLVRSAAIALCVLPAVAVIACAKQLPPPGELVIAVSTDVSIPKDIDTIRMQVISNGAPLYDQSFAVFPGEDGVKIPVTLGIVAGSDPAALVVVRVIGIGHDKALVLREATSQVPTDRTALLQLPLQWLSYGSAADRDPLDPTAMDPTLDVITEANCKANETEVAGRCVSENVVESTLRTYEPALIFGGGGADGGGECFDTIGCFPNAAPVKIDMSDCTVPVPEDANPSNINVALVPGNGVGICKPNDTTQCFVPLDDDASEGWTMTKGGPIHLPLGLCDRLKGGLLATVAVSTVCASKKPGVPTCGKWSAEGTGGGSTGTGGFGDGSVGMPDGGTVAIDASSPGACTGRGPNDASPSGSFTNGAGTLGGADVSGPSSVDLSKLVDGYATLQAISGPKGDATSEYVLNLTLTPYADACGYYSNDLAQIGVGLAEIEVDSVTPIVAGGYNSNVVSAVPTGVPANTSPGPCGATGNSGSVSGPTNGKTALTITSIDANTVVGTFSFDAGSGVISGDFNLPFCTAKTESLCCIEAPEESDAGSLEMPDGAFRFPDAGVSSD